MPTIKVTDAASEPITLAQVKLWTRVDVPDEDEVAVLLINHGKQAYDKAMYVHRYSFESIVQLAAQDIALPYALPDLTHLDPSDPIPPGGTVPAQEFALDGLYHDNADPYEKLIATVPLDTP